MSSGKSTSLFRFLLKAILILPFGFLILHTLVRIIRHLHKFPIPSFLADAIDNPLRRKWITPPDRTALRHGIRKGMTVLEVGPGNGRYTVAAAQRVGKDGTVYVVDIEPDMIARLQQRARCMGLKNIDGRVADVYALPFLDESFDLIYMTAVIGEIPDPARAMGEFQRVLAPNGLLVFSELLLDPDYPPTSKLIRLAASTKFQLKRKIGNFFYYTLHFEKSGLPVLPPVSHVVRSQDAARAAYDRISPVYELAAGSEWPLTKNGIDLLEVAAGEHVLEIGCGPGRALVYIAQKSGPSGFTVGIDLSHGMLRQAQKKLAAAGAENTEIVLGDGLLLPYADASFDTVFLSFTLELFDTPQIPQVLAECTRVLRKDGRLGVVSLAKKTSDPFAARLYEVAHRVFPVLIDCRPIYTTLFLQQSGYHILKHEEKISWGLPVDIVLAQPPAF